MASTKLLLKLNKKNRQGEAPIYIRIIKDRKAQFICLQVYIDPIHWDDENKRVRKSHKNAKWINAHLLEKMAEAGKVALDMETSRTGYPRKKVKRVILGRSDDSFVQFAENYVARLEQSGKLGTHDKAKAVIDKLTAYMNEKELTFDNMDVAFLKEYEDHLRFKKKNAPNTIHSNMKVIRRIINEAIKEDVIQPEKNPFLRYNTITCYKIVQKC